MPIENADLSSSRFSRCIESARAILRDAADRWAAGDAEEPATLHVLLDVLQVFAKERFLLFPAEAGMGASRPRGRRPAPKAAV